MIFTVALAFSANQLMRNDQKGANPGKIVVDQAIQGMAERALNDAVKQPHVNRVYHDWKTNGWDHLTTEETIANSSDLCIMKLGKKLGAEGLNKMLVAYGFGPGGTAKSFPKARPGILSLQSNPRNEDKSGAHGSAHAAPAFISYGG